VAGEVDGLVELSDAIGMVREQLVAAQVAGRQVAAGQVLTFAVGKVSIEFSGEVKKVAGGGGGLKFWVLTAEAKTERSRSGLHKVTIELIPQTPDGRAYIVNDSLSEIPAE
jgi:NTP-dependent ternary system trypsin peptidase co-occuring protein